MKYLDEFLYPKSVNLHTNIYNYCKTYIFMASDLLVLQTHSALFYIQDVSFDYLYNAVRI